MTSFACFRNYLGCFEEGLNKCGPTNFKLIKKEIAINVDNIDSLVEFEGRIDGYDKPMPITEVSLRYAIWVSEKDDEWDIPSASGHVIRLPFPISDVLKVIRETPYVSGRRYADTTFKAVKDMYLHKH